MPQYVEVALKRPIQKLFTYKYSGLEPIENRRVQVPFGSATTIGYCVSSVTLNPADIQYEIKSVLSVIDRQEVLNHAQIETAKWLSRYSFCSIGEAYSIFLPPGDKPYEIKNLKKTASDTLYQASVKLNEEQEKVYREICLSFKTNALAELFGITGSGKSAVYLHLIANCLKEGRQALLLVPEIGLTPQLSRYIESNLPGVKYELLHSRLTPKQRYLAWMRLKLGESQLAVGVRSAAQSHFSDLGLVIIDEEHDGSYQNHQTPRFHTRHLVQKLNQYYKGNILLASATPSIDIHHHAEQGRIPLSTLKSRFNKADLPQSQFVPVPSQVDVIVHPDIIQAIRLRLTKKEQVIVYCNRRGYARNLKCRRCMWVFECPNCSISLIHHLKENTWRCHYCNYQSRQPQHCPDCEFTGFQTVSSGIQKVEQYLNQLIPEAIIDRFDSDSIRNEKDMFRCLDDFRSGKSQILLGTQMVAKGHDFEGVTLVVLIQPEDGLNLPDYRSAERSFSLITQVSGRAGRAQKVGEVILQTGNADHPVIEMALKQDYLSFYREEIKQRELLSYPPFTRLCRLVFRMPIEETGSVLPRLLKELFAKYPLSSAQILGPSPCVLERIKRNFRWQVLFKISDIPKFQKEMEPVLTALRRDKRFYLEVEMDPMDML